jgi:hypothetical protein
MHESLVAEEKSIQSSLGISASIFPLPVLAQSAPALSKTKIEALLLNWSV